MIGTVLIKTYSVPKFDRGEILRYAGGRDDMPQINELIESCIEESGGKLSYKVCYTELPITFCGDCIDFGAFKTESKDLKKNLHDCGSVILFAATVGIAIDRLIARYSNLSPAKALIFQALGAERIESLCDAFNREITEQCASLGKKTRPRFSPGYGDLPISMQKEIFAVLDCPRKIGLTLNENLLMSPSKSVTAIIGVSD